jgi:photosystem II stability/assembly factor-like uncharacterized protein
MKRLLLFSFILIGFTSLAQTANYTALNGPYGGSPNKIISTAAGDLLAISSQTGVFKSSDGGVSWTSSNSGLSETYILDIYRDAVNGKIYALGSNRFYTSSDNGTSWVVTASNAFTNARFMTKSSSGNIFIVGGLNNSTVYRSANGGTNWGELFTFTGSYSNTTDFEVSSSGRLFISTPGQGLFTAGEGDTNATLIAGSTGLTSSFIYSLTVSGADIYALTDAGPFKSSNNGTNWAPVGTGLPCCLGFYTIIEKDPSGGIYLFVNRDVWKLSSNVWTRFDSPIITPLNGTLKSVYFVSASEFFVSVDGVSLYKTTNSGQTWTAVNNGYTGLGVNQILFTDNSRILMASGYNGMRRSLDDGTSWDLLNTGVTARYISHFLKIGSTIFAYGNGIIKSTNNSDTWTEVNAGSGFGNPVPTFNRIVSNDGVTMYSYDGGFYNTATNSQENTFGLWKSTDGGVLWSRTLITGTGIPASSQLGFINDEGLTMDNSGNLYLVLYSNAAGRQDVYKLNSSTAVATKITNLPSTYINDFETFNNKLYALGSDNKLHISTNGGTSWTTKTTPIGNQNLRIISDNTIYILSNQLYVSTDAGSSWVNSGTFTQSVEDVIVSSTNYSYVAVPYSKYYKSIATVLPPNAPTNLSVFAYSTFNVGLKWNDNSTSELYNIIERSAGDNTHYDSIARISGNLNHIIFSAGGLTENTTYYFRVRAVGSAGKSVYSNEVSQKTLLNCQNYTIPINRSWTATTQNLSGLGTFTSPNVSITGDLGRYEISDLTLGWGAPPTMSPGISPTTFAPFIEICGSVYFTASGGIYGNGNGTWNPTTKTLTINWQTRPNYTPYRNERTVFVLNAIDPVPEEPTNVSAYVKASNEIVVTWTGGAFTQQYQVQRSSLSGSGFVDVGPPIENTTTTYIDNAPFVLGSTYYYRVKAKSVGGDFTDPLKYSVSTELALQFQTPLFNAISLTGFDFNSQGVAWIDVDNDNDEDLLITPINVIPDGAIRFFENKGDGTFALGTLTGVTDYYVQTIRALSIGDINNDGLSDFISHGPVSGTDVFINKGNKVFERESILSPDGSGLAWAASLADFNNDGRLDLSASVDDAALATTQFRFFTQNAAGDFIPYELGEIAADKAQSRSGSWADYDNDGDQDFLKTRYSTTASNFDKMYKNNGDGTFTAATIAAFETDAALSPRSVSWADFDNDLDLDVFIVHNSAGVNNMLYQNNGDGTFTRLTTSLPAEAKTEASYGSAWGDIDNDGDQDLIVANGLQAFLYLNSATGTFTKYAGSEYLTVYDELRVNTTLAFGDYDKNGTLDIAAGKAIDGLFPTIVMKNNLTVGTNSKWLEIKLVGTVSNRSAIGARIVITTLDNKKQMRAISSQTGYASAGSLIAHFGLRSQTSVSKIDVYWPSGIHTVISTSTIANQLITITEDGTPPSIVSVSPVNASTSVAVSAKLEITFNEPPVAVAGKKITLFSGSTIVKEFLATEGVLSGSKVTFTPPALAQFTTYTVSVEAGAFADAAGNSTTAISVTNWSFITIDTTPPQFAAFTPPTTFEKGTATPVIFTLGVTDNSNTIASVIMSYRKISGGAFTDVTLTTSPFAFTILESMFDANGLEFYFTAKDAANNTTRLPAAAGSNLVTYMSYKTAVNILPTDRIGFGGTKASWKILSIPFDLGASGITTLFGTTISGVISDKSEFRMVTYKDATAWGEYPTDFSTLSRGKGYFINIKTPSEDIKLPDAISPSNTRANLFQIVLKKGWNQIGNPYLTAISWADVATYNSLTGKASELWKYTGTGYDKTSVTLAPYEGAFVFVDADVTVSIPFSGQTTPGGRVAQISSDLSQENWNVPFILNQDDRTSRFSGVGMNKIASLGMDDFDGINPPRFFDYTEMNFAHPEHFIKNFAQDVVPTQKEFTWAFNVDSNVDAPAELRWDNSVFGDNNKELFLFDVASQMVIDMRSENSYSFHPSVSREFRIYYGENLKDKVNPDFVALGQPYPNPVASKTTIAFLLPGQGASYTVSLDVYDMLGKKVATLSEGNYKSGFYSTVWNTEDAGLANGIYTVRFVVGGKSSAVLNRKVILKK